MISSLFHVRNYSSLRRLNLLRAWSVGSNTYDHCLCDTRSLLRPSSLNSNSRRTYCAREENPLRIAVVGAGLGGMCLSAIVVNSPKMSNRDYLIDIFERDQQDRDQGTCLDIDGPGQEALKAAGIYHLFHDMSRPNSNVMKPKFLQHFLPDQPETNRQRLRDALLDVVATNKRVTVKFETPVSGFDGSSLQVAGACTEQEYDLIIDASGGSSPLRRFRIDDSEKALYTGYTLLHGIVPSPEETGEEKIVKDLGQGSVITLGWRGKALGLQRFSESPNDPRTSFYYYTETPDPRLLLKEIGLSADSFQVSKEEIHKVIDWLKRDMSNMFPPGYHRIVDTIDTVWVRPLNQHPGDVVWREEAESIPIISLGDALHTLPPYSGAGGNLALRDAHELAIMLIDQGAKLSSLRALEKKCLSRAAKVAQRAESFKTMLKSRQKGSVRMRDLSGGDWMVAVVFWCMTKLWKLCGHKQAD